MFRLVSSLRRKMNKMLPFVSVVVITKDNITTIEKCIQSLINQEYPKELKPYMAPPIGKFGFDLFSKIVKKYQNEKEFFEKLFSVFDSFESLTIKFSVDFFGFYGIFEHPFCFMSFFLGSS